MNRAQYVRRSRWEQWLTIRHVLKVVDVRSRLDEAYTAVIMRDARSIIYTWSRWTVSGENAGMHTARYLAPSGPGVLYRTHSPRIVMTA